MPTRFIRESCTTSPNLNTISDGAERLFWRLITVADDFGRFEADPRIIAGRCYPLRTSAGICKQMTAYVSELVKHQLIQCYTVNDRVYGVFITWAKHQRTRAQHSKYPPPSAGICGHLLSNAADLRPSTFDLKNRPTTSENYLVGLRPTALALLTFLNEKAHKAYQPVPANVDLIIARLKEGATEQQCRFVIARKCREWMGTEQAIYLRPATLFNKTKFAQYVGACVPEFDPETNGTPAIALEVSDAMRQLPD